MGNSTLHAAGPMYFNPAAEQVAASLASTCKLATPKDPRDCYGRRCPHWVASTNTPCVQFYRPRAAIAKATGSAP
jgi:hypothetical protein